MNYASPFARRLSGLWSQVGSGNGASLKSFELLPARLFVQPHRRLSHIFGISVNRNASTCLYGASSTSQKIFQGIACISTKVASSKKEHMAVSRKTKRSTITPGSRNSFQSLSPMQLFEIFQAPVNAKNAHEFLAKLQKHRVEGTLEQEVQVPGFTEVHAAQALEWLRTCFPLDEDAAIMMRFEKEDQEAVIKAATYQPQQNNEGREDYGQSQLDLIKQRNLAVAAETQAEEEASKVDNKDIVSGTPAISHPQGRVVLGRRVESAEWVKRYRRKAALSDLLEPPDMTIRARLLPSAIFCVCFIGACVLFAQAYVPPPRAVRIWSDVSPATATILTLVGLNCTAFLLWRIPPLWNFFNRFMLLEPAMPRAVSLLGNTFSHHAVGHLTINMLFLWFVGARCRCILVGLLPANVSQYTTRLAVPTFWPYIFPVASLLPSSLSPLAW